MTILVTRHDKIGDFITALPMCKVLKEQTNHKIVMLVSKVNVALASNMDFIDEVNKRGGIAFWTDNLDDVITKLKSL